jgi:hypothetical protein
MQLIEITDIDDGIRMEENGIAKRVLSYGSL